MTSTLFHSMIPHPNRLSYRKWSKAMIQETRLYVKLRVSWDRKTYLKRNAIKIRPVTRIITVLSVDADSSRDSWANIQAYRRLQHQRLQRQLLEIEKLACLRSGARGYQVRKELVAFEKKVAKSKEMYNNFFESILSHFVVYANNRPSSRIDERPDDLTALEIQNEIRAASELLMELQARLDSVSANGVFNYLNCRHTVNSLTFRQAT